VTTNLVRTYTGQTTIAPGTLIGTMTLLDPNASPNSNPPVHLTFQESFLGASGNVQRYTGTITSAVPEPGSLALLAAWLPAGLLLRRHRCQAGAGQRGNLTRPPSTHACSTCSASDRTRIST
jgi:hypothetical protein